MNWLAQILRASQPLDNAALGYRPPTPQELAANPGWMKALLQQRAGMASDAREGELGLIVHPGGKSWSHEVSTTADSPVGNGIANFPLLTKNQPPNAILRILFGQPADEDYARAANRAAERVAGGAKLPTYKTIKRAERAAVKRERNW